MGCAALIVMFIFMYIGSVLWQKGGLWGPIFFWTSAAIAGTFSAAFLSYVPQIDDLAQPLPPKPDDAPLPEGTTIDASADSSAGPPADASADGSADPPTPGGTA